MDERDLNPLAANLPDASKTSQISQPQIQPMVSKPTVLKKRSFFDRAKDAIFFEDSKTIGGYVLRDILLPAIRDTFYDIVTGGLSMALYNMPKAAGKKYKTGSVVNYGGYYSGAISNDRTTPKRYDRPDKYRTNMDIYNIRLEDDVDKDGRIIRADQVGYRVRDELLSYFETYHILSVQDLATAFRIGNIPATMTRFGWEDSWYAPSSMAVVYDPGDREWYFRMNAQARQLK
jgi:hypothetical protein